MKRFVKITKFVIHELEIFIILFKEKDGYILLRELKIEPFKCVTRPFRTLKLSAVCYCMFSSPEELFKHLEISSIADEDWVISDEANIELEPFENLYTTIL